MDPRIPRHSLLSLFSDFGLFMAVLLFVGLISGCGADDGTSLANTLEAPIDTERFTLVARLAQITDTQIVDEESPGRLAALANLNAFAWRPQERFSIHLLDGMVRAINAYHERVEPIDFLLHTGDAVDNAQTNELEWFLACLDGDTIDPLSGFDDRPPALREPEGMDPHVPFRAAGLYREGVHGPLPTIPWYATLGNHDRYATGIFPIVTSPGSRAVAPLPLMTRIGIFLPRVLDPEGATAYGPITPARPGPPPELNLPTQVPANPDRRFFGIANFVSGLFESPTEPWGHGFAGDVHGWYSVSPVPGLRLIVLDTTLAAVTFPTGVYDSGGIIAAQARFLQTELAAAQEADELIVVASHHPSFNLLPLMGTALTPSAFHDLLSAYPNVVLHLCGHTHRHRVWDRGGYLEMETSAVIDFPQEGRIIEIWRAGDAVELRYEVISHLYDAGAFDDVGGLPPADDPFVAMRREARDLAEEHSKIHRLLPVYLSGDLQLPDLTDLLRLRPRAGAQEDRRGTFRKTVAAHGTD